MATLLSDDQRESLTRFYDVLLERLPFSILIVSICMVLVLAGHPTKQVWVASASAGLAIVAFYREQLWPSESYRSKVVWWAVFAGAETAIVLSIGKWVLVLCGIAATIFIPVLLLVSLYRYWSDERAGP